MAIILVVESNADIRENLVELLSIAHYSVRAVDNGKMAIEAIKNDKPDVIISDISVPELGGYEILHFLKTNSSFSSIRFIFLTTSTEKKERVKALTLGANGYLGKPFEECDLLSTIHSLSNGNTIR